MVKIDVLLDGQPLRTREGAVGFCSVVLVEGPTMRTLVDVGHVGRRNVLKAALQSRGLTADDIDNVVASHMHWDHAQNLDIFPNSKILIHGTERRYAARPHRNDWATPAWSGPMLESQKHIVEVDDGYEIESGITIMHTPGHSVGSICVVADTDDGRCVVSGDVLHYLSVAVTKKCPTVFWNVEQANKSVERIVDTADIIYPGHDRPFRLTRSGKVEYLWPNKLTLYGVAADTPGLGFDSTPFPPYVMSGIEEQTL